MSAWSSLYVGLSSSAVVAQTMPTSNSIVTPDQARASLGIVEDARMWRAQLWAYG